MIARQELLDLLRRRLPQMAETELGTIADQIQALEQGWEEVEVPHSDLGYSVSENCSEICWLASEAARGAQIRILRKKS